MPLLALSWCVIECGMSYEMQKISILAIYVVTYAHIDNAKKISRIYGHTWSGRPMEHLFI